MKQEQLKQFEDRNNDWLASQRNSEGKPSVDIKDAAKLKTEHEMQHQRQTYNSDKGNNLVYEFSKRLTISSILVGVSIMLPIIFSIIGPAFGAIFDSTTYTLISLLTILAPTILVLFATINIIILIFKQNKE